MHPDRLTDAQEAHVRRILREEMARLQPPQLRDLAVLCEAHAIVAHRGPISPFFREEAARREAEAKPVKISQPECHEPGGCIAPVACVQFGKCPQKPEAAPQGEREGPGSAAAPIAWRRECPRSNVMCESPICHSQGCQAMRAESNIVPEDKPTPAADDELPMITAEQIATLKLDVASGEIERGYNVRVCVSQLIRFIEAQAREIAQWQEASSKSSVRAEQLEDLYEKSQARVRELEAREKELVGMYEKCSENLHGQIKLRDWEKARADQLAAALRMAPSSDTNYGVAREGPGSAAAPTVVGLVAHAEVTADGELRLMTEEPTYEPPAFALRETWEIVALAMNQICDLLLNQNDPRYALLHEFANKLGERSEELKEYAKTLSPRTSVEDKPTPAADEPTYDELGRIADSRKVIIEKLERQILRLVDEREAANEKARRCAVASLQWENRANLAEASRMEKNVQHEEAERELAEANATVEAQVREIAELVGGLMDCVHALESEGGIHPIFIANGNALLAKHKAVSNAP